MNFLGKYLKAITKKTQILNPELLDFQSKLSKILNFKPDDMLLYQAAFTHRSKNLFDKKYNSRFKTQNNRNRGLPIIQHQTVKNTVKNLICITNDVYLNLETKNSIILDREFSGTFYYWELDLILLQKDGEHFN